MLLRSTSLAPELQAIVEANGGTYKGWRVEREGPMWVAYPPERIDVSWWDRKGEPHTANFRLGGLARDIDHIEASQAQGRTGRRGED